MLKTKSYAKINLHLEVISKRDDGFHDIITLMSKINLYDEIIFAKAEDFIINSNIDIKDNIMKKAYDLVKELRDIKGLSIELKKNIPMGAGLAGGSSNAYETVKALDELYALSLTKEEYFDILLKLGSDCNFFTAKSAAICTGRGEKIKEVEGLKKYKVLLVNPGINISSKDVYEGMSFDGDYLSSEAIEDLIKKDDFKRFKNNMQDFVFAKYIAVKKLFDEMSALGGFKTMMSGSGSSVFSLFENEEELQRAYELMKNRYQFVIKTHLIWGDLMLQKILEPIFTFLYIVIIFVMDNFINKYNYADKDFKLQSIFTKTYVVFVTLFLGIRTYALFLSDDEKIIRLTNISLFISSLMIPILLIIFYYLAARTLKKRRMPDASNIIYLLSAILMILTLLPQNGWFQDRISTFMEVFRTIIALILNVLIFLSVFKNAVRRRNVNIQRASLLFFLAGLFYCLANILRIVRAKNILYVLSLILILIMIYTWYRTIRKKTEIYRV